MDTCTPPHPHPPPPHTKGKPLKNVWQCLHTVFLQDNCWDCEFTIMGAHGYKRKSPTHTLKEGLKKYLFSVLIKIIQMFLITLCLNVLCNFQNGFSAIPNKVIQTMKILKYKKQRENLEGWAQNYISASWNFRKRGKHN